MTNGETKREGYNSFLLCSQTYMHKERKLRGGEDYEKKFLEP